MKTERPDGKTRMDMLDWQAESFSLPGHQTQDGQTSSQNFQSSPQRLNPVFVEWLMGWPLNWTNTEPTACDAAAMALWRYRLRRRLLNLFGEVLDD